MGIAGQKTAVLTFKTGSSPSNLFSKRQLTLNREEGQEAEIKNKKNSAATSA